MTLTQLAQAAAEEIETYVECFNRHDCNIELVIAKHFRPMAEELADVKVKLGRAVKCVRRHEHADVGYDYCYCPECGESKIRIGPDSKPETPHEPDCGIAACLSENKDLP